MILRRNLSILIVKKKNKLEEFIKVAEYLKDNNVSFFFEDDDSERIMHSSSKENKEQTLDKDYITPDELKSQTKNPIDLVISLGGDGTVLRISSLFPWKVPPVISFNLGTLGFLPAFSFSQFTSVLDKLIPIFKEMKRYQQLDSLNQRNIAPFSLLNRMRLSCYLTNSFNGERKQSDFQIMNEVTVHRGHNVQLGHIDTFVNDNYLTDAMADGLIVSTPTGSTAYSLSAGGPIVHPTVSSMILTPICPRSLSFRSLVLPPHVTIRMKLSDKARGDALVSADGKNIFQLSPGFTLEIRRSLFSIPCIQTGNSEWMDGIVNQLRWNQSFKNNGM